MARVSVNPCSCSPVSRGRRCGRGTSLNTSQGSIYDPSLQSLSIEELTEGFGRVGVREVYRPQKAPMILILTFDTPHPQSTIRAAYLSFEVWPVKPKPLRCKRCQKYGHSQQYCRASYPTFCFCTNPHDCTTVEMFL